MKSGKQFVTKGISLALAAMMAASTFAPIAMAGETEVAAESAIDTSRKTTLDGEQFDKVTIGVADDPKDLGPTGFGNYSSMSITPNYLEALFDLKDNEYAPVLAKDYEEVDDLHWDVHLYDNIYDSEGNHITASDVVFSIGVLQDSGHAVKYDYFEKAEAKDDYTVEFTWTKPIDAVGALEWPWCRTKVFSQKAYEEGNFTSAPVGTGPYVVKEYVPGSHVTLEANENYWQSDDQRAENHEANVKEIEYDFIAETSQHVIALSTGAIQYSQYVPAENLADFEDGGQYADANDVYITQGSALEVLMANNSEGKITADPNFRKAVWYAIDNSAVATAAGTYLPSKALGTPFFSDYDTAWESSEDNYMGPMDADKAKEYLGQTAYNGETLKILGTSDEATKTAMTMIQSLLLNVGINVEINAEDGTLLEEDMLDPDKWDFLYKDCGGGSQIGEYNRFMNRNEFGTGVNMAFINDDKLQELFETASSVDGHTPENMQALNDYNLEQGYFYAVVSPEINAVYSNKFASLAFREGEFLAPGACEYYLD